MRNPNTLPNPSAMAPPLAISVREFCRLTGIGKTKAYELIREKALSVTRIGRRTLISYESAVALITSPEEVELADDTFSESGRA